MGTRPKRVSIFCSSVGWWNTRTNITLKNMKINCILGSKVNKSLTRTLLKYCLVARTSTIYSKQNNQLHRWIFISETNLCMKISTAFYCVTETNMLRKSFFYQSFFLKQLLVDGGREETGSWRSWSSTTIMWWNFSIISNFLWYVDIYTGSLPLRKKPSNDCPLRWCDRFCSASLQHHQL